MWCPNCKNEYRAGITVCPDCKCDLVEELVDEDALVEIFKTFDASLKEKIVKYLQHLNIDVTVNEAKATDEEIGEFEMYAEQAGLDISGVNADDLYTYTIIVPKEHRKTAVREVQTIIKVEAEKEVEEVPSGAAEAIPSLSSFREPSKEFVKAKDRASDYKSSGWTFIFIGVLIVVFIVLSMLGIIPYNTYLYTEIVFIALGVLAIGIGVWSVLKSNKIASSIDDENKTENEMIDFLKQNITKEAVDKILNEETEQEEIVWMKLIESAKAVLLKQFPDTNPEYADELVENYLNDITDNK